MSVGEEKLLAFLSKLGVEDVLPLLKKGGVTSVKGLYDKSFEEWRHMGISYGDCCYLDSSKPDVIEDDDAKEKEEQQRKEREEKERKLKEAREKERREKEEAERAEREREEQEEKEREEQKRIEKEEEERLEKEKEEQERSEREREEQDEKERKERKTKMKQERRKRRRQESEERERLEKEKAEQERKEKEEQEEAERKAEEEKKAEEERIAEEERKRLEEEAAEALAQEKEKEKGDGSFPEGTEIENGNENGNENEEGGKGKKKKGKKEGRDRKAKSHVIVPALSLDQVKIPKKHRKTLSARESDKQKISSEDLLPKTAKATVSLASPRKKDKKNKKTKEKKGKKKDKTVTIDGIPPSKSADAAGKRSRKHKKTLSSSSKMFKSTENITVPKKEDMLKNLSLMGNTSGKKKAGLMRLSPRDEAAPDYSLFRRNTVSELYPPAELKALVSFDPLAERAKKVILCQAAARGFLARKFFQRWRVAHEILATEHSYVEDLELILKSFVAPLEKKVLDNEAIIDRNHIYFIFYNLREIHSEHLTICRLLKNRVENFEEFTRKSVCDIFITNIAKPLSHLYFPYVNNFVKSIKALKKCKRDVPAFQEYIAKVEAKPECHLQDLESLLILPVQRVTRYSILLKSLLGKYKPGSKLYLQLEEASKIIKDRLNEINECKRDAENMAYVDEVLRAFTYEKGVKELEFSARRRFIREGVVYRELKAGKESKPVFLILFSDMLAVTKMREKKPATPKALAVRKYKVIDLVPLLDISMVSLAHANEKDCRSFVFHTSKRECHYHLPTTEGCIAWTEVFSATLTKAAEVKAASIRRKQSGVLSKGEKKATEERPSVANTFGSSSDEKKDHEDEFAYG